MTSMRPLDDLLPHVMRIAPSCPEPVALSYLREAARAFCQAIPSWRDTDTFAVTATDYEVLCTISDAEIVRIEDARLDGNMLKPVDLAYLDAEHPGWYTETDSGTPLYVTQFGPDSVSLYPRGAGTLTMRLLLKPSSTAQMLPASLVARHAETIGRGALGNVLSMPNAEWANPALASAHLAFFARKTNTGAQIRARSGQQGAPLRTKARFI